MQERQAGDVVRGLAGEYLIRRKHGEGGFGVTYEATAQRTGERVILKELRFERLREWKSLELFEREGTVLSELSHPAVPSYRDFFALAGDRPFSAASLTSYAGDEPLSLFLVQSFVQGPTLAARVEANGPLPAPELERILREVLALLVYLHGLSPPVIHRDINPRNLLASPGGRVSLVDFGAIQDRLRAAGAGGSTTVGTLGYMPLEQLRGDARPASDLYALGVTLLVCATGLPPADLPVDEDTGKLRVEKVATRLPERLHRALDAMLEPIVGRRVRSAEEVLALLDRPRPVARPSRPARAPWFVLGATAAVLLAGGLGAVILLVGGRRRPPPPMSPPVTRAPTATLAPPPPPPHPAPPAKASPAAPAGPPAQLSWRATVTSASGLALAPGAACSITTTATPRGGKEPDVGHTRVVCGAEVLYDQDAPLEGTSMWSAGLHESPVAERASVFRAALSYSDMGSRVGKSETSIDTARKQAMVRHETVPVYNVTFAVEPFTAPREGAPLDGRLTPPFDHVVEREAVVTAARGHAPAKVGAKCALRISPAYQTGETCRVTLRCGPTLVYGAAETGYAECAMEGGEPTGFTDDQPTSNGGDPRAKVDLPASSATFSDDVPAGGYELELSLTRR